MKRILSLFALALSAIAASSLSFNHANPTVALKIPPTGFSCGVFNTQSYYCYGLPMVVAMNGVSTTGYLWTDDGAATLGRNGFVNFYQVPVPNAVINSRKSTPDGGVEEDIAGPNYTGKLVLYFTTKQVCTGGRGGGCHTSWTVLPKSYILVNWH